MTPARSVNASPPLALGGAARPQHRDDRGVAVDAGPVQRAKDQGRGGVLFGIHGGNWDMAASECAHRYGAFHSAGESVEPAWLGRLVNRVRRGGHTQLYDSMSAARPLLRALRRGEIIGLVADRVGAGA